MFQDFGKLQEHASMNAKGTGLGLSICKNIIEQMGGTVYAESTLDVGTELNIVIGLRSSEKVYKTSQRDVVKYLKS